MHITGRVFVVTGGGNGIGREVVRALLLRGAEVAVVDVSADALAETARIAGGGDRVSTHQVDLSQRDAVLALPEAVLAAHGRIDGVLNVAGIIQRFAPVHQLTHEEVRRVVDVNLWGVLHMVEAFLPVLLERPAAALVNVSSMGSYVAVPGQTVYGATKAAVAQLTDGLWAELRGTNVAVTTVYPGGVATDIAGNSGTAMPGMDATDVPMQLTTPESAARQIVEAMEAGRYRVMVGNDAKGLHWAVRLAPKRTTALVAKKLAVLVR